jgi:hypothetical protein
LIFYYLIKSAKQNTEDFKRRLLEKEKAKIIVKFIYKKLKSKLEKNGPTFTKRINQEIKIKLIWAKVNILDGV